MNPTPLTPAQRRELKARAHALEPVVLVGAAGLTSAVVKEVERALLAHELIKVRVAGDDREARVAILEQLTTQLRAHPVQHIGKLLVLFRAIDKPSEAGARPVASTPKRRSEPHAKRPPRAPAKPNRRTAAALAPRPPRTARVRKSGQRSTKKPFQSN